MNSTTKKYGLSERDIRTIYDILAKHPEVLTVYIFGSRAKGNFKSGSDLDLAIMNKGVSYKTLLKLKSDLDDSSLPYKADIVDYNTISNPDLVDHIDRAGILFYQRQA